MTAISPAAHGHCHGSEAQGETLWHRRAPGSEATCQRRWLAPPRHIAAAIGNRHLRDRLSRGPWWLAHTALDQGHDGGQRSSVREGAARRVLGFASAVDTSVTDNS